MILAAGLFLDLGRVKQRGDNRRRADPDGYAGFHQLAAALLVCAVILVVAVAHRASSMVFGTCWKAA